MQFHITNLVGPIDITDLTETAVVKDVNLSHIPFRYSPALGAIQKDGLNFAVVKPACKVSFPQSFAIKARDFLDYSFLCYNGVLQFCVS